MDVTISTEFRERLEDEARRRSLSVPALIEAILSDYFARPDDPGAWVRTTRQGLARVWGVEGFSDWDRTDDAP
ncbi:MAG TPA: hypothetical protein VG406_03215 [Isosphaeraceae bacterium]|jgi:hypothetical protein|nr:hypothetical protein [Isosphaeraceae bacterium]